MIKYKIETRKEIIKIPIGFICDSCKTEFHYLKDMIEYQEKYTIKFYGGYGSVFGDGQEVEINLCQNCLNEMIGDLVDEKLEIE